MRFKSTAISGCFSFELTPHHDLRGSFLKLFQQSVFQRKELDLQLRESFYSVSKKGALRGMHFQVPPKDHDKIVIGLAGIAYDVVVDLRKSSESFGQVVACNLDGASPQGLFIPRGCAHGFQALSDGTALIYLTSQEYDPAYDQGIRWDSIPGIAWPLAEPLLSARDRGFASWAEFKSPF